MSSSPKSVPFNFTNDSAMMIAHERFLESSRSDALFHDPFAKAMASDKGEALSANFGANCAIFNLTDWPEFHKVWTSVRTKFINDTVLALSSTGGFRSLVNLGAGYNTRAFHLKCYENFTNGAYEVDMAIVNEQKVTILRDFLGSPTPLCPTNNVNLDFLSETSLAKALGETSFDASQPAIFLSEGLIMYLGEVGKKKINTRTERGSRSWLEAHFAIHGGREEQLFACSQPGGLQRGVDGGRMGRHRVLSIWRLYLEL